MFLKLLIQHVADEPEEADQVGFAGTVGADENVQAAQVQLVIGNGFVALQLDAGQLGLASDRLDHGAAFRKVEASGRGEETHHYRSACCDGMWNRQLRSQYGASDGSGVCLHGRVA
ncbi:MAG: hypothetical protein Q4D19_13385 [Lautropia sp.]|nr:hypothetical protein [Lautropia sp.]